MERYLVHGQSPSLAGIGINHRTESESRSEAHILWGCRRRLRWVRRLLGSFHLVLIVLREWVCRDSAVGPPNSRGRVSLMTKSTPEVFKLMAWLA